MITVKNATLRVKRINGRNGPFCIADLSTDFGEFKVKESLLDQFDEGTYEATVWIDEIYMGQYVAYGKAVTEIRARLRDAADARRRPRSAVSVLRVLPARCCPRPALRTPDP